MAIDKKVCPKCGKECDIGDLYCSCNYKFSFDSISDASSKTTKDKTSYTEELKKRVDDYSLEYRQYDSTPQLSSPNYGEAQSDNIGCAIVMVIIVVIVVIVVVYALLGDAFGDDNSANQNNSFSTSEYSQNEYSQNEEVSYNNDNEQYTDYPSCDADTTLKPMKKDRTNALKPTFENSTYLLNNNYSLWYRNTQDEGNGYCRTDEMIKNLFWVEPDVYISHPLIYQVYYDNDNKTVVEHETPSNMQDIVNNGTFYKGNHKLSVGEVDRLLNKSLPENSNSFNNNDNLYNDYPEHTPKPVIKKKQENNSYRIPELTPKLHPVGQQVSIPQPAKPKTDMEKSADTFFE